MSVKITPSAVTGTVAAPPSKSYTHRAIIVASLADGETRIIRPLLSDDTLLTIDAVRQLGAAIEQNGDMLKITGTGGRINVAPNSGVIFAGNSGSTVRMAAAVAALSPTRVVLNGDARLRQRPVGDLLSALESLGARARSLNSNGCPPIEVQGGRLTGGEVTISGQASSQHITALLMIAPYVNSGVSIKVVNGLRSRPYVAITLDVMRAFGVDATNDKYRQFSVKDGQKYRGQDYSIEGDYSSTAYFLAAGAIGGQPVTVTNLNTDSIQGDKFFLNILERMGCSVEYGREQVMISRNGELNGISLDMGDCPDIVQAVAIVAAYAHGKTAITNIGHLRFKETDRLGDTALELGKTGIRTDIADDTIVVYGGKPKGAELEAHNDHRMAMSLATAALFADGDSIINGAETVAKSYPGFFRDLVSLGAKIEELP
ncbi:MAG TPA: 3-phosphoshikimate 1-carboxyvinyltransferase [Dehalococcoidia bacterium]|nr:3-phosphoshikimate 1-carboxyvinyltransferase [Dehalococcoidia bacterium]